MVRLEISVIERKTTEVRYHSHYIISRICMINMIWPLMLTSVTWEVVLSFLGKEVTMLSLHLMSGGVMSHFWREEYLHKLFGILLHERFESSCPFINLFKYLLISTWTHGYLFYTLGYNLILLCFVTQIILALATQSSFSWLLALF